MASASVNFSAITWKFCSSWSVSVMLGTVVSMEGFLRTHLSAAGAKLGALARSPAGPGWRAGAVLAMTFMATVPTPAW